MYRAQTNVNPEQYDCSWSYTRKRPWVTISLTKTQSQIRLPHVIVALTIKYRNSPRITEPYDNLILDNKILCLLVNYWNNRTTVAPHGHQLETTIYRSPSPARLNNTELAVTINKQDQSGSIATVRDQLYKTSPRATSLLIRVHNRLPPESQWHLAIKCEADPRITDTRPWRSDYRHNAVPLCTTTWIQRTPHDQLLEPNCKVTGWAACHQSGLNIKLENIY